MIRRDVLTAAAGTLAAAAAGCLGGGSDSPSDGTTRTTTTTEGSTGLVVEGDELVRENEGTEEETAAVVGTVVNESNNSYSYVEVRATFLSEGGDELGSERDSTTYFSSGDEFDFEVEYPKTGAEARKVADYELTVDSDT